jgi:CRP-like cAMP-binding protein
MDFNLILTAQTLVLAPHVKESASDGEMIVLKNIPAKTYLHVTKSQWLLLKQFREPRTVPTVLGFALEERLCLPLHEFFELVLKAVRANILLQPNAVTPEVESAAWRGTVRAETIARPLVVLFFVGLVATFAFQPHLPQTVLDVIASIVVLSAALSLGSFIGACVVRGAGGEVYRPRWEWIAFPPHFTFDHGDVVMLSRTAQLAVVMSRAAILATTTGLLAWHQPTWNLLPLLSLAIILRPFFGGRLVGLFRFRDRQLSDADHDFIFPPNLRPGVRWEMLVATLARPETWAKLAYGVAWILAIIYLAGWLTGQPPWTVAFWKVNGILVTFGVAVSLALTLVGYVVWEFLRFARTRAGHRGRAFRLWKTRWFDAAKQTLDEESRVKFASSTPVFRALPPVERHELARSLQEVHFPARRWFPEFSEKPTQVAVIVSGTMGLFRVLPSGRTKRTQILMEGDVVGMQDIADSERPEYRVRSLTPVTVLMIDRTRAERDLIGRIPKGTLTNLVLKRPFLRSIGLCRNWHAQAIDRFAQLSAIVNYAPGGVILEEGSASHQFFIIFEQHALVTRNEKRLAVIHPGEFFGEIGLLQNSSAVARIVARHGTRCLSISRNDFLRFVTHNHLVALELERVSSKRLGRPIFPLKAGNFRMM